MRSGRARLRATVSSRINYLALVNLKPGPMQDVRVRRAMNHAVDVEELIKQVLKGRATRMCGPLAPPNVDYAPAECYTHDPARAHALFKEAGVDPSRLVLTLDTPSGRDRKSTRLNSSHANISYAVFCLKKKKKE